MSSSRPSRHPVVTAVVAAAAVVVLSTAPGSATAPDASPPPAPPARPSDVAGGGTVSDPLPALPAGGLRLGDEGEAVDALEKRLARRGFDPGPADGFFDGGTEFAVMAFEKLMGMGPTGEVDELLWAALRNAGEPEPLLPEGGDRRVEIDLERQLLFLYVDGRLRLVTHVSTGSQIPYCQDGICGSAVTPVGAHRFMWRVNGWRTSRLGRLYNPVYFTGSGIAVHGFSSVPTRPASHGCVRVPMHVAEYFPSLVEQGDPVYVFDGETKVEPIDGPGAPGADRAVGDGADDTTERGRESVTEPADGLLDGDLPPRTGAGDAPAGALA